ncbi:MAG TPA: ribonuclease J, partial [Candidatus Paceibacterota bacterium]|nr:ribonuclease J [Candidatus Paceibacterota bacterium]
MTSAPAPAPAPREAGGNGERRSDHAPRNQAFRDGPHGQGGRNRRGGRGRGNGRPGGASRDIRRMLRRPGAPSGGQAQKRVADYSPAAPAENVVRVIPLGGVEEVGRNMFLVETNGDIFVFDAGFQFTSEDESPGVDYILPNTKYLEENQDRVRAVFVTHGHLDHIGGIPFLMARFGNPPIYTQNLSAVMIQKRQEEYPDMPKPNLVIVEPGSTHTIGHTKVHFFPVTHSIPDSMGISVETPYGNVIVTGDLKVEHIDDVPVPEEEKKWSELGAQNNLLFIADSTSSELDGFSV